MKKVYIIGAGQLGSRHLQALKNVKENLDITVIDNNKESLKIAATRYDEFSKEVYKHKVSYNDFIPIDKETIELAIIATNSNVRRKVICELLEKNKVKYMILEKLLFQRLNEYYLIDNLIKTNNVKTWVNCSMRGMPAYNDLIQNIVDKKIFYNVSGSNFGLVTNAIHYIDHIAMITSCTDFRLYNKWPYNKCCGLDENQGYSIYFFAH